MRQREPFPVLLAPDEACAALRVSRATLYRMVGRGDLEAVRLSSRESGTIRIPADALRKLVGPGGPGPSGQAAARRERPPVAGSASAGASRRAGRSDSHQPQGGRLVLPVLKLKPSSLPPRFGHPDLDAAANEWRKLNVGADEAALRVEQARAGLEQAEAEDRKAYADGIRAGRARPAKTAAAKADKALAAAQEDAAAHAEAAYAAARDLAAAPDEHLAAATAAAEARLEERRDRVLALVQQVRGELAQAADDNGLIVWADRPDQIADDGILVYKERPNPAARHALADLERALESRQAVAVANVA